MPLYVFPFQGKQKKINTRQNHLDNVLGQIAHAIILSSKRLSIDEIAFICGDVSNTVSSWIDNWEQLGFDGLQDKDRPGGPSKLNPNEKSLLFDLASKTPRSVTSMITALFEQTGKLISESTIKRLLKAA